MYGGTDACTNFIISRPWPSAADKNSVIPGKSGSYMSNQNSWDWSSLTLYMYTFFLPRRKEWCNLTNWIHTFCSLFIGIQCSLSSAISRVCTHSGASCRKTNSPTRLCCRYQVKHSKLTEEIRLLSEATTYIFPPRNVREKYEKQFILFYISS